MMPLPNGQVAQIVRDVRDVDSGDALQHRRHVVYQGVTAGIGY